MIILFFTLCHRVTAKMNGVIAVTVTNISGHCAQAFRFSFFLLGLASIQATISSMGHDGNFERIDPKCEVERLGTRRPTRSEDW